ncbi:unnamed protein product [Pleuronectes platessa]|uniref:Uncharacterized protein n=1 Tax=Pleuronectes platessa TaxID=8262 RepID=A0A9N7YYV9_PLEPL|nr:unnamed protein product [Pleuronectes platessa]
MGERSPGSCALLVHGGVVITIHQPVQTGPILTVSWREIYAFFPFCEVVSNQILIRTPIRNPWSVRAAADPRGQQ